MATLFHAQQQNILQGCW